SRYRQPSHLSRRPGCESPAVPQPAGLDCFGLDEQSRIAVRSEQCGQPLRVRMVGVLVRDEHGVQASELVEAGREVAGIDEDAHVAALDEQARVSEVSDSHTTNANAVGESGYCSG